MLKFISEISLFLRATNPDCIGSLVRSCLAFWDRPPLKGIIPNSASLRSFGSIYLLIFVSGCWFKASVRLSSSAGMTTCGSLSSSSSLSCSICSCVVILRYLASFSSIFSTTTGLFYSIPIDPLLAFIWFSVDLALSDLCNALSSDISKESYLGTSIGCNIFRVLFCLEVQARCYFCFFQ